MTSSYCDQHVITDTSNSDTPVIVTSLALALLCAGALLEPTWGQMLERPLAGGAFCLIGRTGYLPYMAACAQLLREEWRHSMLQEPAKDWKEKEGYWRRGI